MTSKAFRMMLVIIISFGIVGLAMSIKIDWLRNDVERLEEEVLTYKIKSSDMEGAYYYCIDAMVEDR